jgi:hypothetical protein
MGQWTRKASQTHWPCQYIICGTSTCCVHTLNTKRIGSDLNSLNTFTKETGSKTWNPKTSTKVLKVQVLELGILKLPQKLDPMRQSLSPTGTGANKKRQWIRFSLLLASGTHSRFSWFCSSSNTTTSEVRLLLPSSWFLETESTSLASWFNDTCLLFLWVNNLITIIILLGQKQSPFTYYAMTLLQACNF